jgi:hypothetical protein
MTFLPIVARELRIRSRWKSTYWWRCCAALAASIIAMIMMVVAEAFGPGKVGRQLFAALAWLAFLLCLIEGARNTADCLSEEKREGTLGLLFLTDLKGFDVVLGKFVAASVGAFFAFVATLPLLGLSLLLGGVTFGEFLRMSLALTSTMFFSLTSGMLISALSREGRQAWLGSVALVGLFAVVLPAADELAGFVTPALALASPWTAFRLAFAAEYARDPVAFQTAALLVNGMGWLWLALASVLLPRSWQEKALRARPSTGALARAGARWSLINPAKRARMIAINPILWLAARTSQRGRLIWAVTIVASLAAIGVAVACLDQMGVLLTLWLCGLGVKALMAVWVAWEACHSFTNLRASGMLELLLAAPLPVIRLVQGEEMALRRLFLGPFLVLAGTEVAIFVIQSLYQLAMGDTGEPAVVFIGGALVGGGLVAWVLDLLAVAHVGLWMSLISRRPAQAWARTLLLVLIGPLFLAVMPGLLCCGVTIPVMLVAKDVAFISWAQNRLQTDFRRAAAGQPVARI